MEHVKRATLEAAKHLEDIVWDRWKNGGPVRERCAAMLAVYGFASVIIFPVSRKKS